MIEITIEGLSHDGRGIGRYQGGLMGRHEGKAVFVANAVPGDRVMARVIETQKTYDEAVLVELLDASPDRITPFCEHYEVCGGCQLQHLSVAAQRSHKQQNFFTALTKAVEMKKCKISPPLVGQDQGYRRRARFVLGRNKADKEARFGFRAQGSKDIVDIPFCPVLIPKLNEALSKARANRLEKASRNLKELTLVSADEGEIWSEETDLSAALPTQVVHYSLDNLRFGFPANGFIQVNAEMNLQMIAQALSWLDLKPEQKVLDLFCGVGNFTLPIAQQVDKVVGVEGDLDLVQVAKQNATDNGLSNTAFFKANLFEDQTRTEWFLKQKYHRVLLDPGRQGAYEICQQMGKLKAEKIVYVSCNSATLMRDVKALENQGYQLRKANLIDMFPHTNHTEVMALLVKTKPTQKSKGPGIFKL